MLYLTFKPTKGNLFIPKLVHCLKIIIEVLLFLLMTGNIVNLLYPFWGWTTLTSIWIGLILHPIFFWLIHRFRLRSFIAAKYRPTDQLWSDHENYLMHLGFLFSVWKNPDSFTLGAYSPFDKFLCPRSRHVSLANSKDYKKWLGWLIILLTDAIPATVLIGSICASFFLGIGSVIFL